MAGGKGMVKQTSFFLCKQRNTRVNGISCTSIAFFDHFEVSLTYRMRKAFGLESILHRDTGSLERELVNDEKDALELQRTIIAFSSNQNISSAQDIRDAKATKVNRKTSSINVKRTKP